MPYIRLRHQVIRANWNEETSKWTIKIQKLDETDKDGQVIEVVDECDMLLNGGGFLKYVIPQTKEQEKNNEKRKKRRNEAYSVNGN
jgi:hypothetical protein